MDRVLVHDISNWQGNLSTYWQLFREKGCKAIIIKATEGLAFYNYWKDTAPIVKEQGFLLGSYHYYRQHIQNLNQDWISCSPTRQAENHFNWLEKCGIKPDLPPALDVEPGNNPQGVGSAGVESCLNRMEQLFGRTPILYSNLSTLTPIAKPHWIKFPLWLAHYTSEEKVTIPKPWVGWTIWQFSDKITYTPTGTTLRKPIDHNWFNGDLMDLYVFCGLGEIEPPVVPEPPIVIPPADRYVRVKAAWLRFRREPLLYAGDTLAVGRGVLLKVTGDKVKTDIDYWPVELDGYAGFVSAGSRYTELV